MATSSFEDKFVIKSKDVADKILSEFEKKHPANFELVDIDKKLEKGEKLLQRHTNLPH